MNRSFIKLWTIWVQEETGYTWCEAAWDDDSTAENDEGWHAEVDRIKKMVADNAGYSMRIVAVNVPGVHEAFDIPEVDAQPA